MATQDVERRFPDSEHTAEEIERLRRLLEASSALLGSLSVEKVLPEVLDLARRTLAADGYALWQLDQDTKGWQIAIHSGLSEEYVEHAPGTISGRNSTEVSFDAPIVAEEIADAEWLTPEHRRAHAAAGTQSMLAVALRHDDRVFGTLAFYYGEPHQFTEAEKSAAWTLGNLAAVAIRTAELYEIQRRRADDRKFVADASEQLASSLDYETTLANVASLAVAGFSDWCAIDMLDESGSIKRLTVAHIDPDKASWAKELMAKYPPDPDAPYGVGNVIRKRLPELFSNIPEELLVNAAGDEPDLLAILSELGLKSTICVPLIARDKSLGAITFVSAESGRRYDESDLATAQDLARHAAIAVDNALLFREAEAARRQAQESLAVVDSVFAAAPIGLAFMDTNFRYVRVNDALALINGLPAEEHYGRTLREVLGDLAEEIEPYHRQVVETGEPILDLHVTGETAATPGVRNWLVSYYPVRDGADVTIGVGVVLTDVTEREQARAAAEAANERLAVLADASQRLASTLDYETTLAKLGTLLVPRYADWYAVDVLDDAGGFKRLAVAHMDPAKDEWVAKAREHYTADPAEPEGTGRAVRTGEALLYRSITDDFLASSTKDPEHHQVLHQLGMESAMVVPLTAGGRTYGALMLVSADPKRLYDEDDLDFAQHLGRRAAVAVDNARLYRAAEEQARASLVVAHVADGVLLVDRLGVDPPVESRRRADHRADDEGRPRSTRRGHLRLEGGDRAAAGRRGDPPDDVPGRREQSRAVALHHRRRLRRRDRLCVPRPNGRACDRKAQVGLRLDDLARAAHAAGRDLRRGAHAPSRRRAPRRAAARRPAGGDRQRVGPSRADRQRHPLGEPARVGRHAHDDRAVRRRCDRARRARRGASVRAAEHRARLHRA